MNIVPTNVLYNSYLLRQNLILLNHTFPFLNIQVVGNSVLGKPIHVVKLGNGPNKVFYSGSIHANEWITSVLLMKDYMYLEKDYKTKLMSIPEFSMWMSKRGSLLNGTVE